MTGKELLIKAKQLLDKGWGQGSFTFADGRVCALGAVMGAAEAEGAYHAEVAAENLLRATVAGGQIVTSSMTPPSASSKRCWRNSMRPSALPVEESP